MVWSERKLLYMSRSSLRYAEFIVQQKTFEGENIHEFRGLDPPTKFLHEIWAYYTNLW